MADRTQVTVDVIVHATEDVDKFYASFQEIFYIPPESFSVQNLAGHFENPITILHAQLAKRRAGDFVGRLTGGLSREHLDRVAGGLDELVSSAGLHIRLDKQEFVQGRLALEDGGAIKVRIYTPVYDKRQTVPTYLALLGVD